MNSTVEPDVDDVPESYPVPEPVEVPDDDDFSQDDEEEVPENLRVDEDSWCGVTTYTLMHGENGLIAGSDLSMFLKLVKHPNFD